MTTIELRIEGGPEFKIEVASEGIAKELLEDANFYHRDPGPWQGGFIDSAGDWRSVSAFIRSENPIRKMMAEWSERAPAK